MLIFSKFIHSLYIYYSILIIQLLKGVFVCITLLYVYYYSYYNSYIINIKYFLESENG